MATIKSKHGHDVEVSHDIEMHSSGLGILRVTGKIGNTSHTHTHTFGALDGLRGEPFSVETLQKTLDDLRQKVADETSWKHQVRANLEAVK